MLVAVVAVMAVAAPGVASAYVFGEGFGFARVEANGTDAPAFPHGPDARAWWAGVCDLHAGGFAVGADPGAPFPNCIEHRAGADRDDVAIGPLSPGIAPGPSGPDGWIDYDTGAPELGSGPSWRLEDVTQAGARPDGSAAFWLARSPILPDGAQSAGGAFSLATADGSLRNVRVSVPPGVVGNPNAVPKCPAAAVAEVPAACPPKTQVGVSTLSLNGQTVVYPVYNVEPRTGKTAEFVISGPGFRQQLLTNVPVVASARTDGDFGVDAEGVEVPAGLVFTAQTFTFWGVPWARSHDRYRPVQRYCGPPDTPASGNATSTLGMPVSGLPGGGVQTGTNGQCSQDPASYDPSWGPIRPFFATQTECSPQNPVTTIWADDWFTGGAATEDSVAPLVDGCEDVPFEASFSLAPTSGAADSATGLNVDLTIPQNNDPPAAKRFNADDDDPNSAVAHWKSTAGLATSHLKDSLVTLPAGFSVNPSGATGLAGCTDEQMGVRDATTNPLLFNDGDPFNKDGAADGAECPDASKIGTAELTTPLLEEKLTGEVVLGTPKSIDPRSGQMFRLFIVIRNRERALVAKVHGTTRADGVVGEGGNGQLVASFENNPRLPFDNLKLSFKDGPHGILATPQACGSHGWTSRFTAWSGAPPVPQGGQFGVAGDCSTGFAPGLTAGMDSRQARGHGTFSFRFSRPDGDQYLRGLTARLPKGLLASVKDVRLCTDAQANAGACPLGSQIGVVDAKAGAGDPFVLEQKGRIYLTEGYKGGEYGLMVKVRPIAGPFRGAMELSTIIVRQAIHVDRKTAQVTAISDPFPQVWHGVPLRVREVTVNVDRPNFMLNPSDCSAKQVGADILSAEGATASPVNHFQAANCADLRFKPRLNLALKGRRQVRTGKHPAIRAVVRQRGISEAGIAKAEVRLPKSLALDVNNAQELCEFDDGTKPDLENHCPKGSIVGRARAKTPLLNDDLVGDVYFVKNVRIDEDTGNEIRTLPMIVVALRGEIAVNLVGESDTTRSGKLVNTFDNVPDAPITRFNLNIAGGKNGILAVTRTRRSRINLCAKPNRHIAEADMDGHNGKRHDFNVRMNTPCRKRRQSAAKVCRKRTDTKQGFRRCVTKVKRHRAQKRRAAQKRKAAKRSDRAGGASRS